MIHDFTSSSHKLRRADEHFQALDKEIMLAVDPKSYTIIHEFDTNTQQHVWKLANDPPSLSQASLFLGDGIHNLRSALDHVVWQLVIRNGQCPNRQNEFPIFKSESEFNNGSERKLIGVSETDKVSLHGLNPYHGGNDAFWMLHQLDIIDKHRYLNLLMLNFTTIRTKYNITLQAGSNTFNVGFGSGVFKKGAIVTMVTGYQGDTGDMQMKPDFAFKVALEERGIYSGELMPVVNAMSQAVLNTCKVLC